MDWKQELKEQLGATDPDDRVADIIFELDDGSTVYGSYDRDSNSYEYSF